MTLKGGAKFKEKRVCGFKYGRDFCSPYHSKSENLNSMDSFCPKYNGFRLKKDRGVTFHDTKQ